MKMTVGKKLGGGFGAVLVLVILLAFFMVNSLNNLNRISNELKEDIVPGAIYMVATKADFYEELHLLMDYYFSGTGKEKILALQKELGEAAAGHTEHESHIGVEEKKAALELEEKIRKINSKVVELMEFKDKGLGPEELSRKEEEMLEPIVHNLQEQLEEHKAMHMEELAAANKLIKETYDRSYTTAVILSLIILLLASSIAFIISRAITNPLKSLIATAGIIATGDLTQEIKITSRDEIGILGNAFKTMIDSLKKIVITIIGTSERVSSSSQQLSSGAQQMNATAQEVSSTVQQIAKGTETQAQKVEETSKVMEQMSASVNQVAQSSQSAASASVQASQSAQKGGEAAKEADTKMTKIYEAITQSATVIRKLGERSEQIGEIVNVINDIADQTNLLSLNAAIEAARAGEVGRGFAVVAEEVRKLAEGSAKATDEISKLIKEVQKETGQAVNSMEIGTKEVTDGREVVSRATKALEEIIKTVQNTASMVQQISAATQQMAAGTKQVVKSVDDIATTAEEAASATEEAGASTEEMTASMEEMAASAQELAQMAIDLRELVGKFKTGEEIRGTRDEGRKSQK